MIDPSAIAPAELGFGRYLGASVIACDHDAVSGWSEPRLLPLGASALPLASAGVQYALSVFEGVKAYRGPAGALHLFRVEAHAERLRASARRLCLPDVEPARFVALCAQATALHEALVPPHGAGALYLRPTLAATESFLGLRAARSHVLAVVVSPCARPAETPVRLWLERAQVRAAPGGLGAVKTGANYAAGLAALETARSRGFDQVLFVDAMEHERLAETGGSNVFVVLDDRVVTPALDDTILAGVTRDSVLALLREGGHRVEERAPALAELEEWARSGRLRELFVTGTAAAVAPVSLLAGDGLSIEPPGGPLGPELRRRLDAAQSGSGPCPDGWRRPVATSARANAGAPADANAGAPANVNAGAPANANAGAPANANAGAPANANAGAPAVAPRTRAEARAFAEAWAAAWSRRDVDAVLAWFADDVRFVSPRAHAVTGAATVLGKPALRAYWQAALAQLAHIAFTVDDVTFDSEARRLVIAYRADFGAAALQASEQLTFSAAGQIIEGAAYHGAPL